MGGFKCENAKKAVEKMKSKGLCVPAIACITLIIVSQSLTQEEGFGDIYDVEIALLNRSRLFWHNVCNHPGEEPHFKYRYKENQTDISESCLEDEDTCNVRCNLAVHARACDAGDDDKRYEMCVTSNEICSEGIFHCSQYSISEITAATRFCQQNHQVLRRCAERGTCRAPSVLEFPDLCRPLVVPFHGNSDDEAFFPSLPITEVDLHKLSNVTEEPIYGVIYIKTYAQTEQLLDLQHLSLFDPYLILFKDFRGCASTLLTMGRVVMLFLHGEGEIIEIGHTNWSTNDILYVCTMDEYDFRLVVRSILLYLGITLSVGGLFITILGLILTKEYLTIPGMNLLCLSISLTLTLLTVIIVNVRGFRGNCLPSGITHVFSVLSALCWMNVLAFDIWQTLSTIQSVESNSTSNNRCKAAVYSAYGWGMPAIMVGIGVCLDHYSSLPENLKPRFSLTCWFTEIVTWGTVIFYHGPIGLAIVVNLILFLLTVRILHVGIMPDAAVSKRSIDRLRYLFQLHIKLFLVIGITWVLEIANLFILDPKLLITCDFIITLQGFFIFLIFTCKRRVVCKMYHVCTCTPEPGYIGSSSRRSRSTAGLSFVKTESQQRKYNPNLCESRV